MRKFWNVSVSEEGMGLMFGVCRSWSLKWVWRRETEYTKNFGYKNVTYVLCYVNFMNSFSVLSMVLSFQESRHEEICKILNSIPWKTIDKRFNMYGCFLWCPGQGQKQNRILSIGSVSSGARAELHSQHAYEFVRNSFPLHFNLSSPVEREVTYLLASRFDALLFWNVRNWNFNWKCGQGGEHWRVEEQTMA